MFKISVNPVIFNIFYLKTIIKLTLNVSQFTLITLLSGLRITARGDFIIVELHYSENNSGFVVLQNY